MPIETDAQLSQRIADLESKSFYFSASTEIFTGDSKIADAAEDRGHSPNSDPTGHANYKRKPHSVYFFYMRYNTDGKLFVSHYFQEYGSPIEHERLKPLVKELALNARPGTTIKNPKPLPDANFQNIRMTRVSYVVVFMDEANWEFFEDANGPRVEFLRTDPNGKPCMPNYSFFKAHVLKMKMPKDNGGEDTRQALCMLNLMKRDAAGTELVTGDDHAWWFDMYKRVRFATADRFDEDGEAVEIDIRPEDERKLTIIADPGGNNLGPPDPP